MNDDDRIDRFAFFDAFFDLRRRNRIERRARLQQESLWIDCQCSRVLLSAGETEPGFSADRALDPTVQQRQRTTAQSCAPWRPPPHSVLRRPLPRHRLARRIPLCLRDLLYCGAGTGIADVRRFVPWISGPPGTPQTTLPCRTRMRMSMTSNIRTHQTCDHHHSLTVIRMTAIRIGPRRQPALRPGRR